MKRLVIQPFSPQLVKLIIISAVFVLGGVWLWVSPVSGRRASRIFAEEFQNLAGILGALLGLAGLVATTWMASSPTAECDQDGISVYRPRAFFVKWDQIAYVDFADWHKSDSARMIPIYLKERGQFKDGIESFIVKDGQEIGYVFLDLNYATADKIKELKTYLTTKGIPTKRPNQPIS